MAESLYTQFLKDIDNLFHTHFNIHPFPGGTPSSFEWSINGSVLMAGKTTFEQTELSYDVLSFLFAHILFLVTHHSQKIIQII